MVINYDVEAIKEFLNHFHKITNLTISFWDNNMNQLIFQPSVMPEFCRMIKSSRKGNQRCLVSDEILCSKCKSTLTPETHLCHAGLVDTAIPIMFDDKLFGFVMFGQVKDAGLEKGNYEEIEKLSRELKLPVDKLYQAYKALDSFDRDKVNSAAKVLNASMYHLYTTACKFTESEMVKKIEEWIGENLTSDISISMICSEFDISKNKLYALWKNRFEVTVGDYILDKRMKKAKDLLLGDDLKIYEVCLKVGISDYNYFSKVFKKYYGVSPKDYRKHFYKIAGKKD